MDNIVLSIVCSAAIAVALAIVVRWGRLDTTLRSAEGGGIGRAVRRLCVLEVSGIMAGLRVGGFGGRLMMRIMAATSAPGAQGLRTEADEIVGKITFGGTLGFLIFVGIGFGIVGAAVYWLVARFLPRRAWASGAVLGLLVLGLLARRDPLDPRNTDFAILSPVVLAVALIAGLFLLYGMTMVSLAARLERAYPRLEAKPRSLVAFVPLLLLAIPPFPVVVAVAVVIGALEGRTDGVRRVVRSDVVRRAGTAAVVLATIAGNVWLGMGIADILA